MRQLTILDISQNNITGHLPACMGQFTRLRTLDLSGNNLTRLPHEIGLLSGLRTLELSYNHLTGRVPYEIGLLSNLTFLGLNNNDLDGVITEEHFASLKSLKHIDLSYNSLRINISSEWQPPFRLNFAHFAACQMGPKFPSWLRRLVDVEEIDISSAGIDDFLPDWFSNVFSNAIIMDMSNNQLIGDMPSNMELMSLEELYLSSNQITGQIPTLPLNLTTLDISLNYLSGPLPSNFGVPNLQILFLYTNHITGHIPRCICNCENLFVIDLANNIFEGELPLCHGNRNTMTMLDLSNNSLSGEFPAVLQNFPHLGFLDLARNNFSGRLPPWIGDFEGLLFLRLSHNMFSGNIPTSMTKLMCIQYLDVANNSISGSLPRDLSKLLSMMDKGFCSLGYNMLAKHGASVFAEMKGRQLNYGTSYKVIDMGLINIDMSLNNLSGELPEDIATLDALVSLNLSWNHLTGKIPNKIGAMWSLESLDLSRNNLSGYIPASVSNLTFLGYLDLSYNNLSGKIPSGPQFDSLYADYPTMYYGNNGLCGAPLIKSCSNKHALEQRGQLINSTEEGQGADFFYFGLGCGIQQKMENCLFPPL
ncbi:hypothetical protein ACP4OV_014240 [Aristida adscensionis]